MVLPFVTVRVTKVADKDVVQPGEVLTYTIRVTNAGHNKIDENMIKIIDSLDARVTYVPNSAILVMSRFGVIEQVSAVNDATSGTPFPFDEAGYKIPVPIKRRGGTVDIQFKVVIASFKNIGNATSVVNMGTMVNGEDDETSTFSVETPLQFVPQITIMNTVYMGTDDGGSCPTAVEFVQNLEKTPIVYCFNVTNTGSTYLNTIALEDKDLQFMKKTERAAGSDFFPEVPDISKRCMLTSQYR